MLSLGVKHVNSFCIVNMLMFSFVKQECFIILVANYSLTKKRHLNRKNKYTLLVVIASVVSVLGFTGYISVWIIERRNKSAAR